MFSFNRPINTLAIFALGIVGLASRRFRNNLNFGFARRKKA